MDFDPRDIACCRGLLRTGSRSFHAASFLLPSRVRDAATALYAFCRVADDAIDHGGGAAALDALHARLCRIYAGSPIDAAPDRAFAAVVQACAIPQALPEALLEGFEWDVTGRPCDTLADVQAYSARVAGTVGVMMAMIMDVREPWTLGRAADLGIAMQLSNIARDVGEDAAAGRLYLPRAWMDAAGIDVARFLRRPRYTPRLAGVVARLLDAAEASYARADAGIERLPLSCRQGIRAARLLYAEIGHEVRRRGCDSVTARAVVPPRRKLTVFMRSLAGAPQPAAPVGAESTEQARFLVTAAAAARPALPAGSLERTLTLFERLARRDRARRIGGPDLWETARS